MAVQYHETMGIWTVDGRGAYATEADAKAAEAQGSGALTYDDSDFAAASGQPTGAQASTPRPAATSQSPTKPRPPEKLDANGNVVGRWQWNGTDWVHSSPGQAHARGNIGGAGGAYAAGNDATRAAFDATHRTNQGGVDWGKVGNTALDVGGFALDPIGGSARIAGSAIGGPALGYMSQMATGPAGALVGSGSFIRDAHARGRESGGASTGGVRPASTGGTAPGGGATQEQLNRSAAETAEAEREAKAKQDENAAENDSLFSGAMDRYDALGGGEYGLSDEARGYQREGLAQQRMLLEKLLDFDADAYATQFGDQALSRSIALGRQGTSAAEQQAGRFAALEQAPALYAEGARQANALESQRFGLAEQAAKAFGDLGTMTRGQDESRAQFEAKLPLEIANNVAALTQGKMALNQQESQMFSDVWMDFARLQSVYAGMSSAEQMAWWDKEMSERGQDLQFQAIKEQLKAQGKVTDKDLINGLFQLGGGALGIIGRKGAT